MIRSQTLARIGALALMAFTAACSDDNTGPEAGESELISRITITLTPVGGGTPIVAAINDPDGNGPQPPQAQSAPIALRAGTTYNGLIKLENATVTPPVDITKEVEAEKEEHRFFYTVQGGLAGRVSFVNLDVDRNGAPVGLTFQVQATAGAATAGSFRVVLSHYDDAPKGNGQTPSNETDVDVTYQASVQ